MPVMDVILEGDNSWPDLRSDTSEKNWVGGEIVGAAALPGGTLEGDPTVAFHAELEDGTTVLVQTTLRLFLQAAAAFKGRYGEP